MKHVIIPFTWWAGPNVSKLVSEKQILVLSLIINTIKVTTSRLPSVTLIHTPGSCNVLNNQLEFRGIQQCANVWDEKNEQSRDTTSICDMC